MFEWIVKGSLTSFKTIILDPQIKEKLSAIPQLVASSDTESEEAKSETNIDVVADQQINVENYYNRLRIKYRLCLGNL